MAEQRFISDFVACVQLGDSTDELIFCFAINKNSMHVFYSLY